MKKTLIIVFFLISTCCFSQRFQLGVKGGINISNFSGGSFEDVDKRALVGFQGGPYLRFSLGSNLSIQPEALISTQGAKIDSVNASYNWKLTYINVPVMVQYRFTGGIFVELGPQVGFLIDESIANETIGNFANSLDLSIGAGLGFRSARGFGIGGRYVVGISKVGDFDPSLSGIDPDFRNGVLQFSLYIPLTK